MSRSDRRTFIQSAVGVTAAMAITPDALALGPIYRPPRAVTVAVIGGGPQGREILAELAKFEDVNVAAVCELDSRRLRRSVRRTKAAKGYADWKDMIAKESAIQGVFVATPTHLHKDIALGLLEMGKHVYCEAPMASSIDDLQAMARAAKGAKTAFQVGHPARSNPVYKLARSFFRSGSIDDVVSMHGSWHRKLTWRTPTQDASREKALNWRLYNATSSGLPGEVGSHLYDALHWFTKKVPTSVKGQGAKLLHDDGREVPDTVLCQFGLDGGVSLVIEATLANSFGSSHVLLNGTMGTIKLAGRHGWLFKEADAPVQGWEVYANRQQFHDERGITLIADATKLASQGKLKEGIGLPHPELYYSVERFLKSVAEGKPVACTAEDGLRAGAVAIRAHEATLANGEVTIEPDLFTV
ncbi:MAG: Gfo/Idh/MocA family oxidoreductase [Planctomycetota bacterium]|nr:Gfo/Idh/MocA family oxidoreductase [Planctomycetota bacterium]